MNDYKLSNINCSLDLLNIKVNDINDSLIIIGENEIIEKYNEDKDEKYKNPESITVQYILWENIDSTDLDSTQVIDMQDSLASTIYRFFFRCSNYFIPRSNS